MIKFKNEVYDLERNFERKLLHEALDESVIEYYDGLEMDEEAEREVEEAHEAISDRNEKALDGIIIGMSDVSFEEVSQNVLLEEALKEAGYIVESSNVSRSLYVINDKNQEVRIADHKRPAAPTIGGNYVDHEYDNELIIKDNKVTSSELSRYGIKLEEGDYYLG